MPRVTLYNPPLFHYTRQTFGALPSLSLAYLSAVLNRDGIETKVIDLEAGRVTPERLPLPDTDIIGFTVLSANARGARECIEELRKKGYRGKVVVGGAHITVHPEGWEDLAVTGECEGNITELILNATGIQEGKRAEIDDLPLPDWEHHSPNITTYQGQYRFLSPRAGVSMWTRGCPYSCIYCSDIVFNHQPKRYRKPESIEAELRYLKSRGITKVYVYDDEVIGSKAPEGWMKELADRLEPLGMSWMAQARCSAKYVTEDVLKDAKRAGCKIIQWGVESFSPEVLKAIQKHTTPDDIWHSLKTARRAGIQNAVFTMVGNYRETEEDLKITARQLERGYQMGLIDYRQTFVCQTMEGTELERIAKAEGWYKAPHMDGAFMKLAQHNTPWLQAETLREYRATFDAVCPVSYP